MRRSAIVVVLLGLVLAPVRAQRPQPDEAPPHPWMNTALSPDERASLVLAEMTLDEKIGLVHGLSRPRGTTASDPARELELARSNGGAGFAPGIPRLGLPDLQLADVGVAFGALIGRELRDQGYNASLGGGVYACENPHLLTGVLKQAWTADTLPPIVFLLRTFRRGPGRGLVFSRAVCEGIRTSHRTGVNRRQ